MAIDPGPSVVTDGATGLVAGRLAALPPAGPGAGISGLLVNIDFFPALLPFGGPGEFNTLAATRINGGSYALDPPPSDAFDEGRDIRFSVTAVPEPAGLALLGVGLGAAGLAGYRRRAAHRTRAVDRKRA